MMNYIPPFSSLHLLLTISTDSALFYFGTDFMKHILEIIPKELVSAFKVIGGVMPALGIAILVNFLGKKHLVPYFFLGFFIAAYFN